MGRHSPWVSRLWAEMGQEVLVANARRVRLITESSRKDDRRDAGTLARLDPQLLSPIRHRSAVAQAHPTLIRARAARVKARSQLVKVARGLSKARSFRSAFCEWGRYGNPAGRDAVGL